MSERIVLDPFSHALYRWAYDYHNVVNDMTKKYPGVSLFAVKYNNACLAFELIVKAHIAHTNHLKSPEELERLLAKKYGHDLKSLLQYSEDSIGLDIDDDQKAEFRLVSKFYESHMFRYPPIDFKKVNLNHGQLVDAVNTMRCITALLLIEVFRQTKGFEIGREKSHN